MPIFAILAAVMVLWLITLVLYAIYWVIVNLWWVFILAAFAYVGWFGFLLPKINLLLTERSIRRSGRYVERELRDDFNRTRTAMRDAVKGGVL